MKTNNKNISPIFTGACIYQDKKGRPVYYKERQLTAYVLDESSAKQYSLYKQRYYISFAIVILMNMVLDNMYLLSILIGVCFFFIITFRFHKKYLPTLVQIKNFVPEKKPDKIEVLAQEEKWKLIVKAILYPLVGMLIILNAYMSTNRKQEFLIYVVGFILFILGIWQSIQFIKAVILKNKNN